MVANDRVGWIVRAGARWVAFALVASIGLAAGGAGDAVARESAAAASRSVDIEARSIPHFRASSPGQSVFGRLKYRGGLSLTSADSAFGGWSGLVIEPDGRRILAVSDTGAWLSAEMVYRGDAPVGLTKALMGPVVALKGRALDTKRDLDAESMTAYSGDLSHGSVLIGFERNHRIGVFPVENHVLMAPVRYLKLPPEARHMRRNAGFEAVVVLRDGPFKGSVVAFSERYPGPTEHHTGWIWVRNAPQRLSLVDHGGFDITDAASLPDGTLVLLERRFRWTEGVKMRLRRFPADAVKPGAVLDGEVLLEADLTSQIDNMEGLAAHRSPSGEIVLTVLSDNNFNTFLQRNLLLQFTLLDDNAAAKKP
ncbi:MAG: esterase-like activity of phytase family protein [Hyphomicrobiaceae bacterium]